MAGVEVGDALDGAGADGAEVGDLVDFHAALLGGTVDALALVTAALKDADALGGGIEQALLLVVGNLAVVGHFGIGRRGDGCALGQHVGPLALEVDQRGEVGLPGLGVGGIHGLVAVVIEVFVAQARIGVAELVDEDLMEGGMVAGGDGELVVDAPAAIGVAVDQDDDVLEGDAREHVVEAVDVLRHQVAVAVEGVVVGAHGGGAPQSQVGHAGAAGERLGSDGNDVEAVLERGEGLMGKQGIDDTLAVGVELAHLGAGVALGDDGQVDALGDVGVAVKGALGGRVVALAGLVRRRKILRLYSLTFPHIMVGDAVVAQLADEDVGRVNGVGHRADHLAVEVDERDGDIDGLLGHGHIVAGGKGAVDLGGLLGGLPLLEQGREGVHKQHLARGMVLDLDLAVALEGHIGQAALASGPAGRGIGLLKENLLVTVVAGKHIVQPQRAAIEITVKVLGHGHEACQNCHDYKECSFHHLYNFLLQR